MQFSTVLLLILYLIYSILFSPYLVSLKYPLLLIILLIILLLYVIQELNYYLVSYYISSFKYYLEVII